MSDLPTFFLTGPDGIGCRVLGDRVIVRPDFPDDVVERIEEGAAAGTVRVRKQVGDSVIEYFAPEEAVTAAVTGVVIGVGEGVLCNDGEHAGKRWPLGLKEGDRVYHSMYGVTDVEIAGEKLKSMRADDIHMVLGTLVQDPEPAAA